MRLRLTIIFLILLSLLTTAKAGDVDSRMSETEIDVSQKQLALLPRSTIIADPERKFFPEVVLAAPESASFKHSEEIVSFGFSHSAYWFLISLNNPDMKPLARFLVMEPTWLDDVQVYLLHADGSMDTVTGGDWLSFEQRALPHRNANFELSLPPGSSRLLVRTQTVDPYLVNMTLWERSAFYKDDGKELLYFGFVYGVILAMMLYNLVLYISVRETVYAAYVAYLFFFLLMNATYNGFTFPAMWPASPVWGNWAHSFFIYLYVLSGLWFAIHFLELRTRLEKVYRWAKWLGIVILLSFIITALFGYALHVRTSIVWVVIYAPFVLVLGIVSLKAGNRAARLFLTAAVAGFIGSFITAVTVLGIMPYSFESYHAVDIGMLIDSILLSLALADRLRLARAETEQAKVALLEATRTHADQLQRTVDQRTSELRKANATKDKFFSIIAHDLRGPIGSMKTMFHDVVAKPEDLTPETLELARVTADNTASLLDELLLWARSQKGEIAYNPEAVDLRELLKDLQDLNSVHAKAKSMEFDLDVKESYWAYADPPMVHTILRNLINNALKFSNKGGRVIAAIQNQGDYYCIRIEDSGVGIATDVRKTLFNPDYKPRSTISTDEESGTGLGLILCAEFVQRNKGKIGVDSVPGKGSTFWFTLPRAENG